MNVVFGNAVEDRVAVVKRSTSQSVGDSFGLASSSVKDFRCDAELLNASVKFGCLCGYYKGE